LLRLTGKRVVGSDIAVMRVLALLRVQAPALVYRNASMRLGRAHVMRKAKKYDGN
jgi:hypothetical protein